MVAFMGALWGGGDDAVLINDCTAKSGLCRLIRRHCVVPGGLKDDVLWACDVSIIEMVYYVARIGAQIAAGSQQNIVGLSSSFSKPPPIRKNEVFKIPVK